MNSTCDTGRPVCGQAARLYAAGWRCDQHRPSNPYRGTNAEGRQQ